jgi:hypothetical protein
VTDRQKPPVPRIGLRWPAEVADALGVSEDWLADRGIGAELRIVRRGKIALVSALELERWLERNSARLMDR